MMRLLALLCFSCSFVLTSCANTAVLKHPVEKKAASKTLKLSLSELDTGFLYLAAQGAIQQRKLSLAIRFLDALVDKDGAAIDVQMQLAELLLQQRRNTDAMPHLETILHTPHLSSEVEEKAHILHAQAWAATKQPLKAIEELTNLLAKHPKLFRARLMQIRLLAGTDDRSGAYLAIAQGIRAKDRPELRRIQAQFYMQDHQTKKATHALKAMQNLAPDDVTPALILSQIALQEKNTAKAERVLRTFMSTHPGHLLAGNALGRLLIQNKRAGEALEIYENIAKQTDNDPKTLSTLGLLYFQEKQYKKAISRFQEVLKKQATTSRIRLYLGVSLEADQQTDHAIAIYKQIPASDETYHDAQLRLAGIEFRTHHSKTAATRLLPLLKVQPVLPDAWVMLSSIRLEQKAYQKLLDESTPALNFKSIPIGLLFNRAAAYEALKKYPDAEKQLRIILTREPKHAESLNFLGYMYAEQGIRLHEAETLIQRALKQKPQDGYFLDSLAWVYYQRGEYRHALTYQKKAVKQVPDDAVMQQHLGDMQWRSGHQNQARKTWSAALKMKGARTSKLQHRLEKGLESKGL